MALAGGILIGTTAHARLRPKKHAFRYKVYYLCFALKDKAQLGCSLLSLNRFNLFSFYDADHGRDGVPMEEWIRNILTEHKLTEADGDIVLMTLPRVMGYVFNPVSFWFCLDKAGSLRAVLAEVNNTFNDRHCYLLYHDDHRAIQNDEWFATRKVFHVSPFMEITGRYEFRFDYSAEKIAVAIHHFDADGLLLTTSVGGQRHDLNTKTLARCFIRYPMMTIKVITLIHYHALKLVMKGIRYRRRPLPPLEEVSR